MNRRLIRCAFAVALALVLSLAGAAARASDVKAALSFVPADAAVVMGVDFDKTRTSPLYRSAVKALLSQPDVKTQLDELRKATGVDPLADIHLLLAAFPAEVLNDEDQFLILAQARVSEARLVTYAQAQGAPIRPTTVGSGKMYLIGNRDDGALAFRGELVLLGSRRMVENALAQTGPSSALGTHLAKLSSRPLFAAAVPTVEMRKKLAHEVNELSQLQSLGLGMDLTKGLTADGWGSFATAAAAKRASTLLSQGLQSARTDSGAQQIGLAPLFDAISVDAVGADVTLRIALAPADLDRIQKKLDGLLSALGEPPQSGGAARPAPGAAARK